MAAALGINKGQRQRHLSQQLPLRLVNLIGVAGRAGYELPWRAGKWWSMTGADGCFCVGVWLLQTLLSRAWIAWMEGCVLQAQPEVVEPDTR